jgi:hypothetical protein
MGQHQIKKFLHSKGDSQTEETDYRMREIFPSYTSDKRLITRIYRKLKKGNSPRINNP